MMTGNPNWWSMYVNPPSYRQLPPPPPRPLPSTLLSSSSTSPYFSNPQFIVGSSSPAHPLHNFPPFADNSVIVDQEQLPHSWSQFLLGGLPVEEMVPFQTWKLGNWESEDDKISNGTPGGIDTKQEAVSPSSNNSSNDECAEELLLALVILTPSTHSMMPVSSPTSCVTSLSGGGNMWDFSKNTKESGNNRISHHSSEVRKEKLGDRITALHQLASPFGKTDTASVLFETVGYIRFLQGQIEVLGEVNYAFFGDDVTQVGNENGVDYWALAFGGGL